MQWRWSTTPLQRPGDWIRTDGTGVGGDSFDCCVSALAQFIFLVREGSARSGEAAEVAAVIICSIMIESAGILDDPAVEDLIAQALERAAVPLDFSQKRKLIVRAIAEKQRPRRPAK